LTAKRFACVIGAGLRSLAPLPRRERWIDAVRRQAPPAKICFQTTPADSAEAVRRRLRKRRDSTR
jgi:hypothetical protein